MRLSPPSLAALQAVCRNLRLRDREEIAASSFWVEPDELAGRIFDAWFAAGLFGQIASIDDEPVASLIFLKASPTTASVGLLATERWGEIAVPFAKHCRANVRPEILATDIQRIECRLMAGHTAARQFLAWFGAKRECLLPGWGMAGKMFEQWAWTREGAI